MRDRSLFERLEIATHPQGYQAPFDANVLMRSVLDNIARLFNTRKYSCESRLDYGIPDLNDIMTIYPQSVPLIEQAIRTQIEKFEPRLHAAYVHFETDPDNPLALGFYVDAVLIGENDEKIRMDVKFKTQPDDPLAIGLSLDAVLVGRAN